jgi:hypothetical protein
LSGTNADNLARLLGDVVDRKTADDVNTVPKVQALANIVASVIAAAAPGSTEPTVDQLKALGLTGVTEANLSALLDVIEGKNGDGSETDTVKKLQDLINGLPNIISGGTYTSNPISDAAQANNATASSPTVANYTDLSVTGVTGTGTSPELLGALASALNSAKVDGAAADEKDDVQAIVNAYTAILAAANGQNDKDPANGDPTRAQYAAIGVTGVDSDVKASLLSDVIDIKAPGDVNTVAEILVLAGTVAEVTDYAIKKGTGTVPSSSARRRAAKSRTGASHGWSSASRAVMRSWWS